MNRPQAYMCPLYPESLLPPQIFIYFSTELSLLGKTLDMIEKT